MCITLWKALSIICIFPWVTPSIENGNLILLDHEGFATLPDGRSVKNTRQSRSIINVPTLQNHLKACLERVLQGQKHYSIGSRGTIMISEQVQKQLQDDVTGNDHEWSEQQESLELPPQPGNQEGTPMMEGCCWAITISSSKKGLRHQYTATGFTEGKGSP